MGKLLLDTCATIWVAAGDPISPTAKSAIERAEQQAGQIGISTFTAWEVGTLAAKGRIALSIPVETWFQRLSDLPQTCILEASATILIRSTTLPGAAPKDPADRIIISTAREHALTIVTRDQEILEYANQGHVSALEC